MQSTNLEKSKKFTRIGTLLVILIVGALLFSIISTLNQNSKTPNAPKSRQEIILDLPYITADYSVVYSDRKDEIYVNVINPPYEENRQKALDWLVSQGASIDELDIEFFP